MVYIKKKLKGFDFNMSEHFYPPFAFTIGSLGPSLATLFTTASWTQLNSKLQDNCLLLESVLVSKRHCTCGFVTSLDTVSSPF